jgi:zinc/manganese transport system substrate-binding protein
MRPGADIHAFQPSSGDMAKARGVDIILASGKGLESYLPRLKSTLGDTVRVVEAGNAVPSIKLSAKDALFACCPAHAAGSIDSHWWHSISGMKKAAAFVAKEFGRADPANAGAYAANAQAWSAQLESPAFPAPPVTLAPPMPRSGISAGSSVSRAFPWPGSIRKAPARNTSPRPSNRSGKMGSGPSFRNAT